MTRARNNSASNVPTSATTLPSSTSTVPFEPSPAIAAQPEVLLAILLYSFSSAVGQNFVYFTLTQFNPLILTTPHP